MFAFADTFIYQKGYEEHLDLKEYFVDHTMCDMEEMCILMFQSQLNSVLLLSRIEPWSTSSRWASSFNRLNHWRSARGAGNRTLKEAGREHSGFHYTTCIVLTILALTYCSGSLLYTVYILIDIKTNANYSPLLVFYHHRHQNQLQSQYY